MTDTASPRPRRRRPAAASRILTAGLSVAGLIGLTTVMGHTARRTEAASPTVEPTQPPAAPPQIVVRIVRRTNGSVPAVARAVPVAQPAAPAVVRRAAPRPHTQTRAS